MSVDLDKMCYSLGPVLRKLDSRFIVHGANRICLEAQTLKQGRIVVRASDLYFCEETIIGCTIGSTVCFPKVWCTPPPIIVSQQNMDGLGWSELFVFSY